MFFNTLLAMFLKNMSFNIFKDWMTPLFNSIGTLFKMGLIGIIATFFKIGDSIYAVFESLALATDIFDKSTFSRIANNMYTIFGVIILFIIAYNFLMYVIDPEKNSGDTSIEKMLKNLAKVFIIIILLPTIFNLANGLIGSIVEGEVIQELIFGNLQETDDCESVYSSISSIPGANVQYLKEINKGNRMGKAMGAIFSNFFNINGADPANIQLTTEDNVFFPSYKCWNEKSNCTLKETISAVKCTGNYSYLVNFGANWAVNSDESDELKFEFFLALLSIAYIIYVLVSFCFDLAVRAVKLAFYQVVAPLCVGCSILPGPKKEIYTKWRSLTIKTYTSVLIRIFAMSLGTLFISMIDDLLANVSYSARCDGFCKMLVSLFLILGLLTVIKQVPKIIDELMGEESGLGQTVRDKFKQAGGFALGAAAGALGVGALRGVKNARNKGKELKQKRQELKDKEKDFKSKEAALNKYKDKHKTMRGKKGKELQAQYETAKAEMDKAKTANSRAKKGMLGSLAGIGAGSLSSAFRSIGASTNSFGLGEWKKEFSGMGSNVMQSAGAVDTARTRRADRKKHREEYNDAVRELQEKYGMTHDVARARVKQLQAEKERFENQKNLINALKDLKVSAGMSGTNMAQILAELKNMAKDPSLQGAALELKNAQANFDKARMETADGTKVHSQADLDALQAAVSNAQVKVDTLADYESKIQQIEASGLTKNGLGSLSIDTGALESSVKGALDKVEVQLGTLDSIVAKVDSAEMALASSQKIEEIKAIYTSIANPDQSSTLKALQDIQGVLEGSMKKAEDNASALLTKFGDKITVGFESSLQKSTVLCSGKDSSGNPIYTNAGTALNEIFNGKSVKMIESLSNEIKECTDSTKLSAILQANGLVSTSVLANPTQLLSELKAGLSSFNGAYAKEQKKQVIDSCSGAQANSVLAGLDAAGITDPLLSQIRAAASVASESFKQANLGSIFGTTSFTSTSSRKDSMDRLTEAITELSRENAIKEARTSISNIRNPKDKK